MKYKLDEELKSLSMLSGSLVGRFYPLLNAGYSRYKCKSDDDVTVTAYSTAGYEDGELYESVLKSKMVDECINRRITWINRIFG